MITGEDVRSAIVAAFSSVGNNRYQTKESIGGPVDFYTINATVDLNKVAEYLNMTQGQK